MNVSLRTVKLQNNKHGGDVIHFCFHYDYYFIIHIPEIGFVIQPIGFFNFHQVTIY